MNKRKVVIANWKMKLSLKESEAQASALKKTKRPGVDLVICPSFVSLPVLAKILKRSVVILGAQDVFWKDSGAFTGEISPTDLKTLGCKYIIVGHSERRQNLGETDEMINKKTKVVLSVGMTPVVCIGESIEQRQKGSQDYVLIRQVTEALSGVNLNIGQEVIIAYEPIWAIGTGQAVTPEQVSDMHKIIRQTLIDIFSVAVVDSQIRIIYGGSVDGQNVSKITELDDVDGVLVGTAACNYKDLILVVNNA